MNRPTISSALCTAACLVAAMFLTAAPAQAVVLPPDVAQKLETRIDTFVSAPGYEPLDVEAMLDDAYYARFDNSSQSALPPDTDLDPVTRAMLLFVSQEASLGSSEQPARARFRITRHQASPGGDWYDVRHSYIEITRYNLAPAWQRMLVANYGDRAAPPGQASELPNVSWRVVTTGLMGQRAAIVAASRRVVGPYHASRALCMGLPCLALGPVELDAGDFESMPAPELASATYRGSKVPEDQPDFAMASPVRIAQEMFRLATGEYDELHEGATFEHPEMTMLIDLNSTGQERNSQALMHLTALMDDAISQQWIKRLEVPGGVEWRRLAIPRQRGH